MGLKLGRGLWLSRLSRLWPILVFFLLAVVLGAKRLPGHADIQLWAGRFYASTANWVQGEAVALRGLKGNGLAKGAFGQPVRGTLAAPFGWRTDPGGMALFSSSIWVKAPFRTPVKAAEGGQVSTIDFNSGQVGISLGGGVATDYLGLGKPTVLPGERVTAGESLGEVGPAGTFGFQVTVGGKAVDPLGPSFLGKWTNPAK